MSGDPTEPLRHHPRPRWSSRAGAPLRRLGLALAAMAGLLGALVGGCYAWVHATSSGRMYDAASAPRRDVALVLGAGLRADGTPTPFLAARLDLARDLFARGAVRAILVSGDNRTHDYDEPTAMRTYLIERGVPVDVIVADFAGLDTYDSCYRASAIFGAGSVTVISQGYHLPRALAVCSAIGLDAVGVGDETGRAHVGAWESGSRREILANVKAAWDVASHRVPTLGPPEPGLTDILRRP